MTDTPAVPEPRDPLVEIALLRGALFLCTRSLQRYHAAPHFEIESDGTPMMEVIVPADTREKADEAITRANNLLRDDGPGRPR